MSRYLLYLLLFLAWAAPTLADDQLTTAALRRLGVNPSRLQPIAFSHNDKILAAFDRATFEQKKEGVFYHLWFFEINRDGTFGEAHSVPLGLKSFEQGEFTPDDSKFVVLGNRGTTFQMVDLKTYQMEDLFIPEWGKAGFRADPAVLWSEAGKLFVIGHPYDQNRFIETRTVATLRPNAPPEQRFQRSSDIGTLEKGIERLGHAGYLTDSAAFFGQRYPELTIMSYWNGNEMREFDRGWKFSGFWSRAGRLLYSVRRGEMQESELTLYDARSDRQTVLAKAPVDYRYLFLSRDGKTALTSQVAETYGRLNTWYARESEGWELKPVGTDSSGQQRTLAAGWMRISSNGRMMAHIGSNGITLFDLR
ncbi:MAG: hypothetical protein WC314_06075 [Vulcanimicrobiota bacterium]